MNSVFHRCAFSLWWAAASSAFSYIRSFSVPVNFWVKIIPVGGGKCTERKKRQVWSCLPIFQYFHVFSCRLMCGIQTSLDVRSGRILLLPQHYFIMLLMLLIFSTNIFKEHHQLMEIDVFLLNSFQISRVKCIFVSDAHTLTYAQHLLGKNYNGITRRSKNKSTDLTVSVDVIFSLNPFLLRLL